MTSKPFFWSISRVKDYFTCPRQYEAKHILKKIKFEHTQATLWGNEVHKAFENYTKSKRAFAENTKHLQSMAEGLSHIPGDHIGEQKHAFTREKELTKYFGADVYGRCIVDLTIKQDRRALTADYKTGSPNYVDDDQITLSNLCTFLKYPDLDYVQGMYIFTKDLDYIQKVTTTKAQVPQAWAEILNKVNKVEQAHAENAFPPKPSGLCKKWCPVHSCEYNGQNDG